MVAGRSRRTRDPSRGREQCVANGPILRPALRHDVGLHDLDPAHGTAQYAEGHRQAVVFVGLQHALRAAVATARCVGRRRARRPARRALLSSVARSASRSLSLRADEPDAGDRRGRRCGRCDSGERRHEVGRFGESTSMPTSDASGVALDAKSVRAIHDRAAHPAHQVGEPDVALRRRWPQARSPRRVLRPPPPCPAGSWRKMRPARRRTGAAVAPARDDDLAIADQDAVDAERRHDRRRQLDVRPGDQRCRKCHRSPRSSSGADQHQGGEVLAGHVTGIVTSPPRTSGPVHGDREVTWLASRSYVGAERGQARRGAAPSDGAAAAARRRRSPGAPRGRRRR